jgi:hypothetical protein
MESDEDDFVLFNSRWIAWHDGDQIPIIDPWAHGMTTRANLGRFPGPESLNGRSNPTHQYPPLKSGMVESLKAERGSERTERDCWFDVVGQPANLTAV